MPRRRRGRGPITRWLAERTGPTGTVVAIDVDTDHIEEQPAVEIHRHDINEGLPDDRTYDLIHARLVLTHLPRREEVFKTLVDALAPGGWLVLGEFSGRLLTVMSTRTAADVELWERMQHLSHEVVSPARGISFDWAYEVDGQMVAAGLGDVEGRRYSRTTAGSSAGCLLHRNLNLQAEPLLRQAGATDDELRRYRELMLEPSFRAWFYEFVCTRGRRPVA